MQIVKVGITVKQGDDVVLRLEGDLPPDCVVVFMDKESYEELKALTEKPGHDDTN